MQVWLRRYRPHNGCFSGGKFRSGKIHVFPLITHSAQFDRCGPSARIFILLNGPTGCTNADYPWFPGALSLSSNGDLAVSPSRTHVPINHAPFSNEFKFEHNPPLLPTPATMSSQPLVLRSSGDLFKGTKGNQCGVVSNTFKLRLPDKEYYHYDRECRCAMSDGTLDDLADNVHL